LCIPRGLSGSVPPALAIQAVDPVQSGLVTSLNRPGGNITGIAALTIELDPKRLELLHQLTPPNGPFGVLLNSSRPDTQIQVAGIWLSSRGRNDSLKELDRSVIERSYSRRRGGSCNTGLRGLMVAGDSKADARNKQNTIDQRYTARPFAVFQAIRRPCNFVKSRAFHRSLHQEARTRTLANEIISEFFKSAVTAVTRSSRAFQTPDHMRN
jgi:hypothetical protein